ncbi:MAG TPA: hypothetical protein ENH89_00020 [Aurantimonas coralicida]|uniref:Uncharacterized protein n=2 Tax=root TaxID=1 RepID=A0A9C9NC04_9HYPH|nr:hypothetical protein [Aurantimonas coralicida]
MTRAIDSPEPGFFRLKLTRGGPWVPAILYRPCPIEFEPETFQAVDRHYRLVAEIDGKPADVHRVWTSGERITIAEYLYLTANHAWVRQYAPDLPEANPGSPIDFNVLQPPSFE